MLLSTNYTPNQDRIYMKAFPYRVGLFVAIFLLVPLKKDFHYNP